MPHAAAPPARDVGGGGGGSGGGDDDHSSSPLPYRILVEFAYKHVDFHLAELESILECNGIVLLKNGGEGGGGGGHHGGTVQVNENINNGFLSTTKTATAAASKKYCRIVPSPSSSSSSSSGAATSGVGLGVEYRPPYAVLEFSSPDPDIGETIMSQCTLVRCAVELWGVGDSVESCVASTREFSTRNKSAVEPHQAADKTWKITVHALGSTIPVREQERIRSQLSFLEFAGPVRLKDPHSEFLFLKEVPLDATGPAGNLTRSGDASSTTSSSNSTTAPEDPTRTSHGGEDRERSLLACYFGRVLGGIRTTKNRAGLEQYTLKKRAYLGPTSMDAELAFVMASLGKVKVGSFVYDPFVGTGSILVACALKGAAHVVGADIDIRVLRGRSPTENIQSNFAQFQLPRPELLRTDNAIYHRHYRRHATLYDAIVTDPPYGIRAGARKCGSKLDQARPVPEDCRSTHIPQTRYGRGLPVCSLPSLPRWFS
jgi:tRNA (guanine10-N2)-methyltransferase